MGKEINELTAIPAAVVETDLLELEDNPGGTPASVKCTIAELRQHLDNEKTIFGTGDDSSVYFNATNLLIDPEAEGTIISGVATFTTGALDLAATGENININLTTATSGTALGVFSGIANGTDPAANAGGASLSLRNQNTTNGNFSMIEFLDTSGTSLAIIAGINVHHTNNEGSIAIITRPNSGALTRVWNFESDGDLTAVGNYQVLTGAGVIGATGYAFNTDGDTGMYLPATGNLGFTSGGGNEWRLNGTGFGPTSDNAKLLGGASTRVSTGYFGTRVTLGLATGEAGLLYSAANGENSSYFIRASANTSAPAMYIRKARGSMASLADAANADTLGSIVFQGRSGSGNWPAAGTIRTIIDGTFTSGSRPPGKMVFYTGISDGAEGLALTLDSSQRATFGSYIIPLITDTDGTVEGSIWYDASEDKLKFKTAAGVETITSS